MGQRHMRYVEVPGERLLSELRSIGASVVEKGGRFVEGQQGREVVVDVVPPGGKAMVRVFTSLARGAETVRACGADAIRIVVGVELPTGFRPLEEGEKVLRTAPQQGDRVRIFLNRLRQRVRLGYGRAMKVPTCPGCGSSMARRKTKQAPVREFFGCVRYPECKGTLPVSPEESFHARGKRPRQSATPWVAGKARWERSGS